MVTLWVVLMIVSFTSSDQRNKLASYIPDSSKAVLNIQNRKIINRVFFDILFDENTSVQQIKEFNLDQQDFNSGSKGINLLQNIVVFQTEFDEETITGFLFELTDSSSFSEFHLKKANEAKYFNDEVGCILLASQHLIEAKRKKLEDYAKDIISRKQSGSLAISLSEPKKDEVLSFNFIGDNQDYFKDFTMEVLLKDSSISFNGVGKKNQLVEYNRLTDHEFSSPEKNPFVEINLGETSDNIQRFIADLLSNYKVQLPIITAQQIIYYGFYIDDINGSPAFLPQFDGIFHFKDIVDFNLILDSLTANDQRVKRKDSTGFSIGSVLYNVKQLAPDEVAIFTSIDPAIQKVSSPPLPSLSGNPSAVLNFDGTGFIAQMARMVPPVKNARIFLEDLSTFDFGMSPGEDEQIVFKGELRFKDNKNPTLEIINFLMKF
mgnify:FL=1